MKQETFDALVEEIKEYIGTLTDNDIGEPITDVGFIFHSDQTRLNILELLRMERELTMDTVTSFNLFNNRLNEISSTLLSKGKEYGSVDRLHNFRVASTISGESMNHCAKFFQLKHLISIQDLLTSKLAPTLSMINEKIGDAINYEILMYAINMEEV